MITLFTNSFIGGRIFFLIFFCLFLFLNTDLIILLDLVLYFPTLSTERVFFRTFFYFSNFALVFAFSRMFERFLSKVLLNLGLFIVDRLFRLLFCWCFFILYFSFILLSIFFQNFSYSNNRDFTLCNPISALIFVI